MVRRFALALCLCLVAAGIVQPAEAKEASPDLTLTYYYKNPDPKKVPELLLRIDNAGNMREETVWPMAAFLSVVYAASPATARSMVEQSRLYSASARYAIGLGISMARLPEKNVLLDQLLHGKELETVRENLKKSTLPPLLEAPLSPPVLDMLWAAFMASGNTDYVSRIITILGDAENRKDTARLLTGSAARWSITGNAVQHPLVLDTCKKALAKGNLPPATARVLTAVIQEAEEALRTNTPVPPRK